MPASQSHGIVGRPTLPDRQVKASTIGDACVSFIFYCNPALPLSADIASLREAFRTPPRSGGKAFDTFAIYELVQKFYRKEIKTWTELTTTLGVEPPDPTKDESAQKVAQYGVRLKKWMNSMHVKAFFEYLMNIPNDYWTRIPNDPNPVGISVRDGVAIEDDMALRALLSYIRPKRGRKRPEGDDGVVSPAQRPRPSSSSPSAVDGYHEGPSEHWSALPDARASMPLDPSRTQNPTAWAHNESLQTPVSRWPHSAVTPSTRASFWDDALELRSALTPAKGKTAGHRRGAKNVSSAWKTTSQDPGTRPRGRPRTNRTSVDDSGHYTSQAWTPPTQETSENSQSSQRPPPPYEAARSARPSLSLQVPERSGGSVRLAMPPAPAPSKEAQTNRIDTASSEQFDGDDSKYQDGWRRFAKEATDAYEQKAEPSAGTKNTGHAADGELEDYYFDKMEDRTNVDVLVAYFARSMCEADWRDGNGNATPPVDLEQSTAMVHAMLQTMYKTATSPQAFLINLAALAGSTTLVMTRPKCTRLSEHSGQFTYKCEWEYQFGHVKGGFTFEQVVPATMWAKTKKTSQPPPPPAAEGADSGPDDKDDEDHLFSKEYWQKKYEELTIQMMNRDRDLADLRDKVMAALAREF